MEKNEGSEKMEEENAVVTVEDPHEDGEKEEKVKKDKEKGDDVDDEDHEDEENGDDEEEEEDEEEYDPDQPGPSNPAINVMMDGPLYHGVGRQYYEDGTLFEMCTRIAGEIILLSTIKKDMTKFVEESLQYIHGIEIHLPMTEQCASGAVFILSAKRMLENTTRNEKVTMLPLFVQAIDMLGSLDNLPNLNWHHFDPIMKAYIVEIPRDAPGATMYLEFFLRLFGIIGRSQAKKDFYALESVPTLSRIIVSMFELLKNVDQDLAVRKLALSVTSCLIKNCPPSFSASLEVIAGGILGGLLRVLKGSSVNVILLQESLTLFGDAVVVIFGDKAERLDLSQINLDDHVYIREFLLRTGTSWRDSAQERVREHVSEIVGHHVGSRVIAVRRQLVEMLCNIQAKCSKFIEDALCESILFIYIYNRYDDNSSYQQVALECIEHVPNTILIEKYLYTRLEETIIRLPTDTRAFKCNRQLQQLTGILDGLGEAVTLMCTTNSEKIEEVLRCLADCIEIDKNALLITSGSVPKDVDECLRRFKLLYDVNNKTLQTLCVVLVNAGKMDVINLVHQLMIEENLRKRTSYQLMLAYMLSGLEVTEELEDDPVILMLAEYLSQEINNAGIVEAQLEVLPTPSSITYEDKMTTCLVCLTCTNITLCLNFLKKKTLKSAVSVNCLCAILSQTCSNKYIVAETAYFAIRTLASSNDSNDIMKKKFVVTYSSHILNTISLVCTSPEECYRAPKMFQGFMKFADLKDNFRQYTVIIDHMLNAIHEKVAGQFLYFIVQALHEFIHTLQNRYAYVRRLNFPPHEQLPPNDLTKRILSCTKNLLTCGHLGVQLLSLEIFSMGIQVIEEDDDTLLPMIHQHWSSFCELAKKKDTVVLGPLFQAVVFSAVLSGTFVYSKILKEFWPIFSKHVIDVLSKPYMQINSADYRFCNEVLSKLPEIIKSLDMKWEDVSDLVQVYEAAKDSPHFSIMALQYKTMTQEQLNVF